MTKYNNQKDFMPSNYVSREQAAKMLMTLIDTSGIDEWMIKQPAGSCEWKDSKKLDASLAKAVERSCAK